MLRLLLILIAAGILFPMCNEVHTTYTPNKKEKEWIKNNEVVIGIYPFYPPYAFLEDKGSIVGIFPDIRAIIAQATGLQYKQVFYPNWSRFLEAAKNGEIDIINLIIPTEERRKYLLFTEPIVMDPHVMIVRDEDDAPRTLDELQKRKDLTIAAVKDYFITDYIEANFSDHPIIYYVDDRESIKALEKREADVFMTQKYTGNYFIQNSEGLTSISDIPANTVLSIGVNKKRPMLHRIISKAVQGISDDQMADLINKWSYERYLPFYRRANFWIMLGLAALLFVLILLVWNKTLSKKVKRKTAELLKAKQRAEESDRLKTAFVSNISHEIRTPLNAINGYSELMALEFSDAKIKQYTSDIIANSHRLTTVIENIIIFSQLERGQLGLHLQECYLEEIISNVVVKYREMYPDKIDNIEIQTQKPPQDFKLISDPYYLRKMLGYVFDNAIKFTQKGKIVIGYNYNKPDVNIYVKDTGVGIDPDTLPKIFDRFYKFSVFKDRFSSGTGVGLTVAKGLADKLGFEMDVASVLGEGSSFYFKKTTD